MGPQALEDLRLDHHLAHPPAAGRTVVQHKNGRAAADEGEDVDEPLAEAFGRLPVEQLGQVHVGIGEDEREEPLAFQLTPLDAVDLPEVPLALPRMPDQLLAGPPLTALGAGLPHIPLHRWVGAVETRMHLGQAVMDPLRGVALLVPLALVVRQPAVDRRLVRVELAGPRLALGYLGREILHLQVFPHRLLVDRYFLCDCRHRVSLFPQISDTIDLGHVEHFSFLLFNVFGDTSKGYFSRDRISTVPCLIGAGNFP